MQSQSQSPQDISYMQADSKLSFARGYSDFPAPPIEKIVLLPLNCFGTILVDSQLTTNKSVCFWTLNSVALICMSVLMPIPY